MVNFLFYQINFKNYYIFVALVLVFSAPNIYLAMINKIFPKIVSKLDFFEKGTIVSYVNVYNYLALRKLPDTVQSIDKFTLDGILLKVLLRLFYFKKNNRLSPDFSSYFVDLFKDAVLQMQSVYFIGATEVEIENFVSVVKRKFINLNISGYNNGFVNDSELNNLSSQIIKLNPDIVFVGLGTPKQEIFSCFLKKNGFRGTIYTCGAFISQTANHGFNYYPKFINTLHMRWLYRLIKERGLIKRYFMYYPFATMILTLDFLKSKL
jgi:N-acetylglucosaminyldiphosphoundecaprenol N-acetyl-beta-D-mannosaminyltransferase